MRFLRPGRSTISKVAFSAPRPISTNRALPISEHSFATTPTHQPKNLPPCPTIAAPWFPAVEIVETHHAGKVDSPSGTAVRTAELIADARREVGPVDAPHVDQRARGQQVASVPIHSLRLPGVKAVQDVLLSGPGETVTIRHDTNDDVAYDAGVRAALSAVVDARGLTVGLGSVLGIGQP